jgi:hypothetical protein
MVIGVAASRRFLEWIFPLQKNPSKVPNDRYLRDLSLKINGLRWSDPLTELPLSHFPRYLLFFLAFMAALAVQKSVNSESQMVNRLPQEYPSSGH